MDQSYTVRNVDEEKAFKDILELVSHMPCETVCAMYSCASGFVRGELEDAIKHLIKQGNTTLSAKFPELRP